MNSTIGHKYEINVDHMDWPISLDDGTKLAIIKAVRCALTDAAPMPLDHVRSLAWGQLETIHKNAVGPSWDRIYGATERALLTLAEEVWILK